MNLMRIFGFIFLVLALLGFQSHLTGFFIIESMKAFNPIFIISFLLGISLIVVSGRNISGGLESALDNDVVGVITFVRHGEKEKEAPEMGKKLTKKGREQARALGKRFKEIYEARNEGNLYLASSSSPLDRVYETVKEIVGVEPKYNKPIMKDKRLFGDFPDELLPKYEKIVKEKGEEFANDWYLSSKYGEGSAKGIASFLESNENKFKELRGKGKKFHYIAGTHAGIPEALLKRVMINEKGKLGFKKAREIGGTLEFAEPVNFLLKKDGTYQINFRDKIYDVDMKELHKLALAYKK